MIALDTNILVRYLVQDDGAQAKQARKLIEDGHRDTPMLVTLTAFIETYRVLTKVYGFKEAFVRDGLEKLINTRQLTVESARAIGAALLGSHTDLADLLIWETGKAAGAGSGITFDKNFARLRDVELLK